MARFQEMQAWRACTRWNSRPFGKRASSRSSNVCQLVSVVPIGFTCMPWGSNEIHVMLVLFIESSGFLRILLPQDCAGLWILWISVVCPSLGICKTWLWSTCAVKTAQVATSEEQLMSQPWTFSRRSRHTRKSFGTSRLWHSSASIRRIRAPTVAWMRSNIL